MMQTGLTDIWTDAEDHMQAAARAETERRVAQFTRGEYDG